MQEVYEFLKKCGTYYLATVEGNQPRVRPFGTIDLYNGRLYIQTGRSKKVADQLKDNGHVELCAFDGQTWSAWRASSCWTPISRPRSTCWTPIPV